jgi:hypothetical protein
MYKCPADTNATNIMTARITLLAAIALFSTSFVLANPVPWDFQDSEAVLSEPKSGHSFDNAREIRGLTTLAGLERMLSQSRLALFLIYTRYLRRSK